MDQAVLKKGCLDLINTTKEIYLATVGDDGFPYIRAVENLRHPGKFPGLTGFLGPIRDDFTIHITTNTSSLKMTHIENNPNIALYFCEPGQYHGLMLQGIVEIITDRKLKHEIWLDGWERYYPTGKDDPDYTLLCLKPRLARGWWENETFTFEIK